LTNLWGEIIVMRSVFVGTALTTVMLVALPFLGSPDTGRETTVAVDAHLIASEAPTSTATAQPLPAPTSGLSVADDGAVDDGRVESDDSSDTGTDGSPITSTSTTPTTVARPQPVSPSTPFSAQPAPFGTQTAPGCPAAISGSTPGAPSRSSELGVPGTTSDDLQTFAVRYNEIRVANCLPPVPFANIRYDSCMEDRLFWMAEDPSEDPMSAWGHIGSERSDGVPSVGCDGNLAGGSNNTGATVAQKWWDSSGHRTSLYKPTFTGSTSGVCILFAMTHGGIPNEPYSFTRSAARWTTC